MKRKVAKIIQKIARKTKLTKLSILDLNGFSGDSHFF